MYGNDRDEWRTCPACGQNSGMPEDCTSWHRHECESCGIALRAMVYNGHEWTVELDAEGSGVIKLSAVEFCEATGESMGAWALEPNYQVAVHEDGTVTGATDRGDSLGQISTRMRPDLYERMLAAGYAP